MPYSEESEQALDAISNLDLIPFLMGLLNPSAQVPENIKALSAQCLSSLTEDNDEFTVKLLGPSNYIPQLLQLKDAESPVIRISACGTISLPFPHLYALVDDHSDSPQCITRPYRTGA
jgi:hypothetical protein